MRYASRSLRYFHLYSFHLELTTLYLAMMDVLDGYARLDPGNFSTPPLLVIFTAPIDIYTPPYQYKYNSLNSRSTYFYINNQATTHIPHPLTTIKQKHETRLPLPHFPSSKSTYQPSQIYPQQSKHMKQ